MNLRSIWDHVGINLGQFEDSCGIILELFWDNVGIARGANGDYVFVFLLLNLN